MADLTFTPEVRMLVDGELIHADTGKTFDNIDPSNGAYGLAEEKIDAWS